jgi:cobalt-precorrin-5B (C1)-methyltransferase
VKLRGGYTTGLHASFAFARALEFFLATKKPATSTTKKMDNDDLDVTKGCEIVVKVSSDKKELQTNKTHQQPQLFKSNKNSLKLYAGVGVGVVTKKGLKIEPNFPAINPAPLASMESIFQDLTKNHQNLNLYATISVTDGENIAKQTANEKVGVKGGISILGTTGYVKPISNTAYLHSIESEILFAKANNYPKIILTLGNSSYEKAKKVHDKESIVEVGNFIYDSFKIAQKAGFSYITLYCGIGKLVKLSQGYKNTHNRFGSIDFKPLVKFVKEEFNLEIDTKEIKTVKGIVNYIKEVDSSYEKSLYNHILHKSQKVFDSWFDGVYVEVVV